MIKTSVEGSEPQTTSLLQELNLLFAQCLWD